MEILPQCANCPTHVCYSPDSLKGPKFCPTKIEKETIFNVKERYLQDQVLQVAQTSARVEATGYMKWTRVEEVIHFAKMMGFKTLGIATCLGLIRETKLFAEILEKNGFSVVSVCCKTGGIPKEEIGLREEDKVRPGNFESMCNPIAQAEILNKAGTDFNIMIGLCVGHDSLFLRYSQALTTVLVAKDRVLCHNPVAAIYNSHAYYRRLYNP